MQVVMLALVIVFLSGCMIRSEKSGTRISLNPQEEISSGYTDCVNAVGGIKGYNEANFHSCIIHFGVQHRKDDPSVLRGRASISLIHNTPFNQLPEIKKFMTQHGITCKKGTVDKGNHELIFEFPPHKDDYGNITVQCSEKEEGNNNKVRVDLAFDADNNRMLVDMLFGNDDIGTYHFFDLDDTGAIIKHTKVKGSGNPAEVVFEKTESHVSH